MSSEILPQRVLVRKLVDQCAEITGQVSLNMLQHLSSHVVNLDNVGATLGFTRDENRKENIRVQVTANVTQECQRCLGPLQLSLIVDSKLTVVAHDDEARSLARDCETIVLDQGELDIPALIEEEILLALPIVPLHGISKQSPPSTEQGVRGGGVEIMEVLPEAEISCKAGLAFETRDGALAQEPVVRSAASDLVDLSADNSRSVERENPFKILESLKADIGQEH